MTRRPAAILAAAFSVSPAFAVPAFIEHNPAAGVFSEPASITQREPELPREGEAIVLWVKVGPSFSYDQLAVYYTLDGSPPAGTTGNPGNPSTNVLRSTGPGAAIQFVRNQPNGFGGNDDWWKVTLPPSAQQFGRTFRYLVSGFGPGGGELFATDPADGDNTFAFTTLLAWPGAGADAPDPQQGYPPIWLWKEEAVVGNNNTNVMLDQNGSVYDIYYPSAGAVNGVSTKNEGYADGGLDQFPVGLALDQRGQMHMNQAFLGIRPTNPSDGVGLTYWLTNQSGTHFQSIEQSWNADDSNVVRTTQRLVASAPIAEADISIEQIDLSPKLTSYPTDNAGNPNKGLHLKRVLLTNNGPEAEELNVYWYADWAINGGDNFDGAFADAARGAMVAVDNTQRFVNAVGEYNPTTFGDYEKNTTVSLAWAMSLRDSVGSVSATPANGSWANTSADQGQGWIGQKLTLAPGETKELNILFVGGFDPFAGATGTYAFQQAPVIDQFLSTSPDLWQAETEQHWADWLAAGVQVDTPEPVYNALFKRGLLGTALHLDEKNGGIIAGMHNGAYPYVWPRDAAWAAITLARTGHTADAANIYRFLRDIAFRDVEGWGRKGFWKQKYSTDGYTIWGTPQVDETSCYPWGLKYLYDITGDVQILADHYDEVYEAALASSQDSTIDNRLRYEESVNLVYSMNLWEDSFDVFNYSNASVIRGLEDAAAIADILDQNICPGGPGQCGYHADKALFLQRASDIRGGLDARLAWNGENTDISQLGITYPFEIYPAGHPRAELIADRINGVATDTFGNNHPLMNFSGEWAGLVNRYWGDNYWNNPALVPNPSGSPWFLTTLWYGAYYAQRQEFTPGTGDIDNHKFRIDLLLDELGPMGFGAEQIASNNTLKYPGQTDYRLQTAYPNAWESMSFLTDAVMLFLGYEPDAAADTLRVKPKLPSDWPFMEFSNITLGSHRLAVRVERDTTSDTLRTERHIFTNQTGTAVEAETVVRIPAGRGVCSVTANGVPVPFSHNKSLGSVEVSLPLTLGAGTLTTLEVTHGPSADLNGDSIADFGDVGLFVTFFASGDLAADLNDDGLLDFGDVGLFVTAFAAGCR